MHKLRILFIVCIIFSAVSAVVSQESVQQNEPSGASMSDRKLGIFMDFGFGFANKEPLLYGGFDIEARFFSGNIVLAPSFGYYDVSQGYREVSNDTVTFKQRVSLSFIALKASAYYKISFDGGNFLLLGGGLGYYNGTLKNEWGWYDNNGAESVETSEDSSWTIGVHTGLEYNILFSDSFAVSFGFMNRFAEAFTFDVDTGNDDTDDKINAGIVGIYLYAGCGYIF
ncbi:MAG: hypothetical protein MUC95_08800 [Spirochaetes bacterium]|nr:hypothetical protein [Spirochaetota bacterium]